MTGSWWSSADRVEVPAGAVARGVAHLPGSKSLTHRAYAAALLARKPVTVVGALRAEDTERFLDALEVLGFDVVRAAERIEIAPRSVAPLVGRIDCGDAGTLLRFLTALVTTISGEWTLDGSARLRERPLAPLLVALRQLGARIDELGAPGRAPLRVRGGSLGAGRVRLDAGQSSQFLSALLLAGQRAPGPIEIELDALTSEPYIGLTTEVLLAFRGHVERPQPNRLRTRPSELRGGEFGVEADLSAAAYPAAAAALTGGDVLLERVRLGSHQGDRRLLTLLAEMGAELVAEERGVRVRGGALRGLQVEAGDIPDQVPTLAALAPFARGTTRITGAEHLRLKESDRLGALASELGRAGARVRELVDGLEIAGTWSEHDPPAERVEIDPHGDHRIAMAMALVGLRRPNLSIRNPGVVAKSWPGFWECLAELLSLPSGGPR